MKVPGKMFRCLPKLYSLIFGLLVIMTLGLLSIYIKLSTNTKISFRYTSLKSSSLHSQFCNHRHDTPRRHGHTIFNISLSNLTCNVHHGEVNFTNCLRPSVRRVQSVVKEIEFLDYLIKDRPVNFFNVSSTVVQSLITEYLIEPRLECPYLLAVQASILNRKHERDTVRSTWASVAEGQTWPNRKINAKFKVLFVVANQITAKERSNDLSRRQFEEIKSESDEHNDILYIYMTDNYRNLTLKLLSAFNWVKDNCPCVKFVLKVDYDTFVNLPLLVDILLYFQNRFEFSIVGHAYTKGNRVYRSGRWRIPQNIYPMKSYQEYLSGCGYVLSYTALSKIVEKAPYIHILPVEDAFITGVMRRVTGCRMFSMEGMFTHLKDTKWNDCLMLQDLKILATGANQKKHKTVWEKFVRDSCK